MGQEGGCVYRCVIGCVIVRTVCVRVCVCMGGCECECVSGRCRGVWEGNVDVWTGVMWVCA